MVSAGLGQKTVACAGEGELGIVVVAVPDGVVGPNRIGPRSAPVLPGGLLRQQPLDVSTSGRRAA